ncbi:MAG: beta-galactosidase trimerization domain-containing protein [Acidobacteria bacterium]|nr:beta-galactosidase trimerization domain-containing protein [Acidobacteriota bacterium]
MNALVDSQFARRIAVFFALIVLGGLTAAGVWRTASAEESVAGARLDVPFTLDVRTPHVAWGKPSAGPPVRAFVIPSVSEGRTLVELAQRMDLSFDTVMIDEAWDVNTWTVGTDEQYEARNYKLAYGYLEEDLAKPTPYDVIVLPSLHGWNRLPPRVREAIRERVEAGTGLVLIHPTTGVPAPDDPPAVRPMNDFAPDYEVPPDEELWGLSPLVGVLSDRLDSRGHRQIRPDAVADGRWKRVAEHFITANVPLEAFPFDFFKHYRYQLGEDSTALVAGGDGEPIVAVKKFGKGRVVALGYVNTGLSPRIDWKILGQRDDHWWEYFYSLLCRSILWAAQGEPAMSLGAMSVGGADAARKTVSFPVANSTPLLSAEVMAQVRNEWGEHEGSVGATIDFERGGFGATLDLPTGLSAGRHYVDVILQAEGKNYDWGSVSFDLEKPNEILELITDQSFYTRGDKVQATFKTRSENARSFVAELRDNRERVIGREAYPNGLKDGREVRVTVEVGNYSTNIGWLRVSLFGEENGRQRKIDQKQVRVNFAGLEREFAAYELIMPWYGPPTYQPWTPTLDAQFRAIGVSVVGDPERNFKLIAEVHAPGFGVYWHYRQRYLEQKDKFLESGDKRYLIREPDLADDAWLETLREAVRRGMEELKLFRPLAYYLADESSLTAYGDPFDFSWSPATLAKFRDWLKTQYPDLAALNAEWETRFPNWDAVIPFTTAEAQARYIYAGWMDHRTFMEGVFARAFEVAAETVRREDPGGLPSISGTQVPGPSNAVNWYRLDQIVGYLQPYSDGDQDELHRTMRPELILTGFTGYERHGKTLRHELWHRLFHGHIGASLFWHYTALNADLTLTEQGRDLAETINEIRNEGLALLLRGAERENCGIAVHYSLLSVRGQWITDGRIHPREISNGDATSAHLKRFHANRHAWLQALHDLGYQFDFVTTEQIEGGNLAGYRVLILPDSIALSDGETVAIREFVVGGGLVLSDVETGLMDGHARWQAAGRLDDVLGVQRLRVQSAASDLPPARFPLATSSGTVELEVSPGNPGLRTTTGRPAAAANETLFLIDHRYGAGRSIALNFWMTDYLPLRQSGAQRSRLALLGDYLATAGVRPVADVHARGGEPLKCSEIAGFRKGPARFIAILPEPDCQDAGMRLNLSAPQHVYDLRAHRALGRVAQVSGTLVAGEPLVYALLPSPVGRLSIQLAQPSAPLLHAKPGEIVKFTVSLAAQGAGEIPGSAVHLEVRDSSGKEVDYYAGNLLLANGTAEFSVPLALDDLPGTWRVTARESFTHQTASATFELTP